MIRIVSHVGHAPISFHCIFNGALLKLGHLNFLSCNKFARNSGCQVWFCAFRCVTFHAAILRHWCTLSWKRIKCEMHAKIESDATNPNSANQHNSSAHAQALQVFHHTYDKLNSWMPPQNWLRFIDSITHHINTLKNHIKNSWKKTRPTINKINTLKLSRLIW